LVPDAHPQETMNYQIIIIPAFVFCLFANSAPAASSGTDRYDLMQVENGRYEEKIDKLSHDYRLFPLNLTLKNNLADTYRSYGLRLLKQKQYRKADENFVKALELYPDEAGFAMLRGICNYHLKKYDIARYELERAKAMAPESVDALYFLGLTLYETDNRQQAIDLWEDARRLAPGRKEIAEILAKARKEMAVESYMDKRHSSRFDLTYDPGVDTSFARAVLDVLEEAANQVGAELGHFPQVIIPVAIYKKSDFKAVTNAPDWSGGVFDGKIRVPFGKIREVTPAMRAILFHEYVHAVVYDITRGNCPLWLNEGIAEYFGRRLYDPRQSSTSKGLNSRNTDFRKLEKGFGNLSGADAEIAYMQSYSMVSYMATTYGLHRITLILSGLGKGMSLDEAIKSALGDYSLDYDGLVREWRESAAEQK